MEETQQVCRHFHSPRGAIHPSDATVWRVRVNKREHEICSRGCLASDFCVSNFTQNLMFSETFQEFLIQSRRSQPSEGGIQIETLCIPFAKRSVEYLGHRIGNYGVNPGKDSFKATSEFWLSKEHEKIARGHEFLLKNTLKMRLNRFHDLRRKYVDSDPSV